MTSYKILENRLFYELGRPVGKIASIDRLENGYYKLQIVEDSFCGVKNIKKTIIWTEDKLEMELKNYNIRLERLGIYKKRKIERITHFTKIENLESILEYGLYSLEYLKKQSINYAPSDTLRLDGKPNFICNSFTHPNHKMFYRKRMDDPSQEWVVLGINPYITIHELGSEFYPSNAASSCYSFENKRTSNEALEELFSGERDANLPDKYTTNVQAEVLVKDKIEPKYFEEIHVVGHNEKVKSLALNMNLNYERNSDLFNMRGYRGF